MAGTDDEVFGAPPRKTATHVIGENLDMLSVEEIAERVQLLRAEIVRLESVAEAKQASRRAADAFFKS